MSTWGVQLRKTGVLEKGTTERQNEAKLSTEVPCSSVPVSNVIYRATPPTIPPTSPTSRPSIPLVPAPNLIRPSSALPPAPSRPPPQPPSPQLVTPAKLPQVRPSPVPVPIPSRPGTENPPTETPPDPTVNLPRTSVANRPKVPPQPPATPAPVPAGNLSLATVRPAGSFAPRSIDTPKKPDESSPNPAVTPVRLAPKVIVPSTQRNQSIPLQPSPPVDMPSYPPAHPLATSAPTLLTNSGISSLPERPVSPGVDIPTLASPRLHTHTHASISSLSSVSTAPSQTSPKSTTTVSTGSSTNSGITATVARMSPGNGITTPRLASNHPDYRHSTVLSSPLAFDPHLVVRSSVRSSLPESTKGSPFAVTWDNPKNRNSLGRGFLVHRKKVILLQKFVRMFLAQNLAKTQRRLRARRSAIAKELLSTEHSYNESLKQIDENFIKPLLWNADISQGNVILPKSDISKIFGCLTMIYNFSTELLAVFQERLGDRWTPYQRIGDKLEQFGPFLRMYSVYCDNYSSSREHIAVCVDKYPLFRQFISQVGEIHKLDLSSMLIMPVQRLPRYKLLLEDLIRNTDDSHPDFESLSKAYQQVSDIAMSVNRYIEVSDKGKRMAFLSPKFRGLDEELVQPHRTLILEARLWLSKPTTDPLYFFLFSDILVVIDDVADPFTDNVLNVRMKIELKFSRVRDLPDSAYLEHAIQLVGQTKSYVIVCRSEEEKATWFEKLSDLIDTERHYTRRRRSFLIAEDSISPPAQKRASPLDGATERDPSQMEKINLDGGPLSSNKYVIQEMRQCIARVDGSTVYPETQKPFTLYFLTVKVCSPARDCVDFEYHLHKRYSDFDQLFTQLKRKQIQDLPKPPPRYFTLTKSLSDEVRGERYILLDQFLQDLCLLEKLQRSIELASFLGLRMVDPVSDSEGVEGTFEKKEEERKVEIILWDGRVHYSQLRSDMRTNEFLAQLAVELSVTEEYSYRLHVMTQNGPLEVLEDRDIVIDMLEHFTTNVLKFQRFGLRTSIALKEVDMMEEYLMTLPRLISGTFIVGAADMFALVSLQLTIDSVNAVAVSARYINTLPPSAKRHLVPMASTDAHIKIFVDMVKSRLPSWCLTRQSLEEWVEGCQALVIRDLATTNATLGSRLRDYLKILRKYPLYPCQTYANMQVIDVSIDQKQVLEDALMYPVTIGIAWDGIVVVDSRDTAHVLVRLPLRIASKITLQDLVLEWKSDADDSDQSSRTSKDKDERRIFSTIKLKTNEGHRLIGSIDWFLSRVENVRFPISKK